MVEWSFVIVLYFCSFNITQFASVPNTITTKDLLTYNKTIVSDNGNFELGFFQQGVLRLTTQGALILENGDGSAIWSSTQNSSGSGISPVAQLLDLGNLVVRSDAKGGNLDGFLWQSFDYPTDNLLAGMLLGRNMRPGYDWYLTSWSSPDDPSPSTYAFRIGSNRFPQLLVTEGSGIKFRFGPWNGIRFSTAPILESNPYYKLPNSTIITRLYLDPTGVVKRLIWTDLRHGVYRDLNLGFLKNGQWERNQLVVLGRRSWTVEQTSF